jgi:hypothetical protein
MTPRIARNLFPARAGKQASRAALFLDSRLLRSDARMKMVRRGNELHGHLLWNYEREKRE